jgi:serine-type D-Ala-D-Ala endopeptidase (penicillin-binding protein 7)
MSMGRGDRFWRSAALALLLSGALTAQAASQKAKAQAELGPGLKSAAALVVDGKSGEVIFEHKADTVSPIASLTKLMTALVVIDAQQSMDEVIVVKATDRWKGKGAFSHIPTGAKLTRRDLLRLSLMASENLAARTLANNYPGGMTQFVKTMNAKAKVLGMTRTRFEDPSGLANGNVSNARDLVKLINAVSRQQEIREFSTLHTHEVRLGKKMFLFRNTNLLIGRPDWDILVQKTGFTNDAGQCLVMQTLIDDRVVDMVFLNSFGKLTRTADARRVRKWMAAQDEQKQKVAGAGEVAN